jgi:hypothetical protein
MKKEKLDWNLAGNLHVHQVEAEPTTGIQITLNSVHSDLKRSNSA